MKVRVYYERPILDHKAEPYYEDRGITSASIHWQDFEGVTLAHVQAQLAEFGGFWEFSPPTGKGIFVPTSAIKSHVVYHDS